MDEDKLMRAYKRGLAKLYPRMRRLQEELRVVQIGYARLANAKWALEEKRTEVKVIPTPKPGSGGRKPMRELTFEERIANMNPEQVADLIAKLEKKIER